MAPHLPDEEPEEKIWGKPLGSRHFRNHINMLPSPQPTASGSAPNRLKRPRTVQACNHCRAKKYKCDGTYPCQNCRKVGVDCVFRSTHTAGASNVYSANYVKDLEARLQAAEAAIRRSESLSSNHAPAESPSVTCRAHREEPAHSRDLGPNEQPVPNISTTSAGSTVLSSITWTERLPPPHTESDDELTEDAGTELVDINPLTKAVEFHGDTSSVAFIGRLRKEYVDGTRDYEDLERQSLIGAFHNHTFSPHGPASNANDFQEQFYIPQLYIFLDGYFSGLHFIHPILDRDSFCTRCKELWQGYKERLPSGFPALYFGLLSLGALTRTWTEGRIDGMDRFEWSRLLFERAQLALGKPGFSNDLETIQALLIMAKICQNELNPNLAWMYLGMAIRTSLSAGVNRNTSSGDGRQAQDVDALQKSKTWWGLYSLEIELSFALGRPDTLGIDDFHNRLMPAIDDSEVSIITCMIDLARIMRTISVSIYLPRVGLAEKLVRASGIEASIDAWVSRLPHLIRPSLTPDVHNAGGSLRDPVWARLQRLVLQIRYYNVKMLLLRPFILHAAKLLPLRALSLPLKEAVTKCVNAAVSTIETVYETCRVHTFFRTWFYNVTYLVFAASILLFRAAQPAHFMDEHTDFLPVIEKSLDLLDAMNESVVASKTADVLRYMITQLHGRRDHNSRENDNQASFATQANHSSTGVPASQAVDSGAVLEGMDVFSLGSEFWGGGMWNDLELGWGLESELTLT